ncbi:MAG: hypothetical protein J6M62_09940, partial [Selenomonadaceae bacterium]|nr:hypothetical protein [Selenomonadaceae bacterium]
VFIFFARAKKTNQKKHAGATPPLDPAHIAVYIVAIEEVRDPTTVRCSLCPVLGAKASRGASCAALPRLVYAL